MGTRNALVSYVLVVLGLVIILAGCSSGDESYDDGEVELPVDVDFNLHVRSILSESCFVCHGPDAMAREANLRLDTEEGALAPLGEDEDRYAIVPGSPQQSELYKRIISHDPDYMMPLPDSNIPRLSDEEIAILKRWIEQGAEFKPHWAYIVPEKPELPEVQYGEWPESPIDYFVLAMHEEHGVGPSQDADKAKLLRRVSFDLIGLPPTPDELGRFLADDSPDAYERVVDRLLASDAYGERMATEWMDGARYADTHGYEGDPPNEMWPWREWLINAFNRNMPFDQFTTWQLAGDLLPDATREQILATGFNRLHQQSNEGGIIPDEYQVEYVADRVYTTGTVFLATTMQCARCHDHKYDPISEVEYYEFYAFFDNIPEYGRQTNPVPGPTLMLPDDETQELIDYLEGEIATQEQSLQALQETRREDFFGWQEEPGLTELVNRGMIAHLPLDEIHGEAPNAITEWNPRSGGMEIDPDSPFVTIHGSEASAGYITGLPEQVDGVNSNALEFSNGNFINLGGDVAAFERTDPFSFSFWINPADSSNLPVLEKAERETTGNRGYAIRLSENRVSARLVHGWPYNAIKAITSESLPAHEWSHVVVTYDGSSRAGGLDIYINGHKAESHIEYDNLKKNIVLEDDERRNSRQPLFIAFRNTFQEQSPLRFEGLKLDEIKIYDTRLSEIQVLALADSDEVSGLLAVSDGERSEAHRERLFEHYLLHHDPEFQETMDRLRALRVEKSGITDTLQEVMVMEERLREPQAYVRERGTWDQLGENVSPGTPSNIMEFPDDLPRNRLGLAQWILSPDNPLTARVIVNRYWQMFFGEGLVDTPEDFGNQGSMPSHPELLDWLAVTFLESGWDLKELHKQIVMSRTYRQTSQDNGEFREADPQNRLLTRGPRHRLPAEMIRDNALRASGLLVDSLGGPSVYPYQPEGLWAETTRRARYVESEGEGLYRRSLYTFIKRTSPPPGMMTFDAAPRTHPVVSRYETNTPLQALHTMNDRIYVEASRHLAERMMREGGDDLHDQITFAFITVVSRIPDEYEMEELQGLYDRQLSYFQEDPERADALLSVGESPPDETLDVREVAARAVVANTILNLHETLVKQ